MVGQAQRFIRFSAAALLGAALLGCNSKDPVPQPPPPPPLTEQGLAYSSWHSARPDLHDRLLLAHAMARGKTEAIVMVATRMGGVPAVAAEIARMGGEVQARFDDVGYLRVRLPLDRWTEVGAIADVLMAHLEGGGAGGMYAHDRDPVHYSVAGGAGQGGSDATDTLLHVQRDALDAAARVSSNEPSGSALSSEIEALLRAAADANVTVVTHSSHSGRFPEGGQDLFALMANRAVEFYGKPMFAPAGDGARVDSINGAAAGRRVLAIGTLAGDNDREAELAAWSSRGPAADGGSKPDLLAAAGESVSTAASARVASATAELVAAARAENLPADARHITWALRMSGRRLDHYQAHEQGFGVMDVTRATELLRQVKARRFELPDILTRAPVKSFLARFLPEPGVGQGLYEREGWLLQRPDKRVITLLRQNGPPTPLAYTLQWQGNDGTFRTLQDEVILPFDTAVDVEIEIAPAELGIHSALLYLIDKTAEVPVHAVMTTVVASEQFTAANGYTIRHSEPSLAAERAESYFLEVPPNVSSLRVDVAAKAGQVEILLGTGAPIDAKSNLPRAGRPIVPGGPAVMRVAYPPPGVYELTLVSSGQSKASVETSASIHYVDSQLDQAPPQYDGKNYSTTLWMNNIYAPLEQSSVLTEVGARRVLEDVGGPTGMRAYNITVPAGSTTLRVSASPPDGRARLGLYLYDCASGSCRLWDSDALTKTVEKFLIVPEPRAGLWRVVIDAGAAGTAFDYAEIITHPRFGSGTAAGEDEPRRTGARWNQKVSFQMREPVPFGYDAVAVMDVIDPGSEVQERAAPYSQEPDSGDARNRPRRPLRMTTQVFKLSEARGHEH